MPKRSSHDGDGDGEGEVFLRLSLELLRLPGSRSLEYDEGFRQLPPWLLPLSVPRNLQYDAVFGRLSLELLRLTWNMMKSSAGFLWGYCLSLFLVAYDYEMTKPSSGVLWFSCRFLFPETCNKFQVTRIPLSTVAYELLFYLLNLGAKAPWKPYLLLVVLVASATIEIL